MPRRLLGRDHEVRQADVEVDATTLEQAVGEHHQPVTGLSTIGCSTGRWSDWITAADRRRRLPLADEQTLPSRLRRIGAGCPGGRPHALAGGRIDLDADDGGKCIGFLRRDETAQLGDRFGWAERFEQVGTERVAHLGHQRRRLEAVTRSVPHDQCDVARLELEGVVPVAADLGPLAGGAISGRQCQTVRRGKRPRQRGRLQRTRRLPLRLELQASSSRSATVAVTCVMTATSSSLKSSPPRADHREDGDHPLVGEDRA